MLTKFGACALDGKDRSAFKMEQNSIFVNFEEFSGIIRIKLQRITHSAFSLALSGMPTTVEQHPGM
ncbi:MAG: hypothetical protein R6U55_11200 [Desulfovermiculus sp.]